MSRKRKKISVKDLRKHIINTKKVDGGKIHTIKTPNAGNIEIVEGNKHSKGGVNYIKTSDGVTHEIENNEVVLDTDKGPYVVSDYMNTDGTKNYSKDKTSYADLVKYLAMAGASKQDLERVAMETEIANGNDPNNPTSLIQDTNVMQQPKVNLEYQEPVKPPNKVHWGPQHPVIQPHPHTQYTPPPAFQKDVTPESLGLTLPSTTNWGPKKYQQTSALMDGVSNASHGLHAVEGGAHLLKRTLPRVLSKAAWPLAVADGLYQTVKGFSNSADKIAVEQKANIAQQNAVDTQNTANKQQLINQISQGGNNIPTEFYQQTNDRQSKSGKDNFFGNLFGPRRTEVQVGGDDVRLDDKGSKINNQILEYNILDGDTTGVNQLMYTNQYGGRTLPNGDVITTTDELNYNILDGSLVITDKSGKVHNNVTQVSNANNPSLFKRDLKGGSMVRTNTSVTPEWPYGNVHINEVDGNYTFGGDGVSSKESVNTFRNWMSQSYPNWNLDGEPLSSSGPMNKYVKAAVKTYGKEFSNAFNMKPVKTTTDQKMSTEEINKLLKVKYQQPYQYKGGGTLKRKYQEPTDDNVITTNIEVIDDGQRDHDGTTYVTNFEGTDTNVSEDYLFNYDANLKPITEDPDNTYSNYEVEAWTHENDKTPNVYPSQQEFFDKGFHNVQEWRDWVQTQPGFENYDFGDLGYWGPKHQEVWKGMRTPVIDETEIKEEPCVGPNCEGSSFSSNTKKIKDKDKDGKKINWKKWGGIGLAGLAAFGAYKAIAGQMGKTDEMLEAAKNEKPNMIGKQQLGKVDLQRISNRTQMVDAIQRGQSMDNSVQAMNIPEGAKYLLKERNTIKTQGELNKIKSDENNVNIGIAAKEGGLNAQLSMKQAELNTKVDVANQLEQRDIREQKYAAWDRQVTGRQQLISDLISLGGQGIEAYATLRSKSQPLTNDKT